MATTTDLDAKTDTGAGDRYANEERHGILTGNFDREINVRGILWSGVWLAVVTILANILMWWFLRGFQVWDEHHEVKMAPMAVQNPQQKPQGPLLQPEDPRQDRNQDMYTLHADEEKLLDHAGWVDREGGTLRVPVDVAIDAIAGRGVAPFPATSGGATGAPAAAVPAAQSPEAAANPVTTAPAQKTTPTGSPAAQPAPAAKPPAR
jgi:hypothetical protein